MDDANVGFQMRLPGTEVAARSTVPRTRAAATPPPMDPKMLQRLENRKVVRDSWKSRGGRIQATDRLIDTSKHYGSEHPVTGLPEVSGTVIRHKDTWLKSKMPIVQSAAVPAAVDYHVGSPNSWRKHASREFVPLDDVSTLQHDLSVSRLHELVDDRGKSDNRSARGLEPELPKMYKSPNSNFGHIVVDGNHRVSADGYSGKLFTEARVAKPTDVMKFKNTNFEMQLAKDYAFKRSERPDMFPGRKSPEEVEQGMSNLWRGRKADGGKLMPNQGLPTSYDDYKIDQPGRG